MYFVIMGLLRTCVAIVINILRANLCYIVVIKVSLLTQSDCFVRRELISVSRKHAMVLGILYNLHVCSIYLYTGIEEVYVTIVIRFKEGDRFH